MDRRTGNWKDKRNALGESCCGKSSERCGESVWCMKLLGKNRLGKCCKRYHAVGILLWRFKRIYGLEEVFEIFG